MARVQNKNTKSNKGNEIKRKVVGKKELSETNPKREPSKNEVRFFKIGVWLMALTLVVLAAVLLVQYFTAEAEVGPFDDNIHIDQTELQIITKDNGDGTFGEFSLFPVNEDNKDLRDALNENDVIYIYFYSSSSIDEEIKTVIESLSNIDNIPILFIDLDLAVNETLFENVELAHLNLDADAENMLLVFDLFPEDEFLVLFTNISDILFEINQL